MDLKFCKSGSSPRVDQGCDSLWRPFVPACCSQGLGGGGVLDKKVLDWLCKSCSLVYTVVLAHQAEKLGGQGACLFRPWLRELPQQQRPMGLQCPRSLEVPLRACWGAKHSTHSCRYFREIRLCICCLLLVKDCCSELQPHIVAPVLKAAARHCWACYCYVWLAMLLHLSPVKKRQACLCHAQHKAHVQPEASSWLHEYPQPLWVT